MYTTYRYTAKEYFALRRENMNISSFFHFAVFGIKTILFRKKDPYSWNGYFDRQMQSSL